MISKNNIVEMSRAGLLREVELLSDLSITVETTPPRHSGFWSKHSITQDADTYKLLVFLGQLKQAGDTCNMIKLAFDKQSRLYSIPKDIYDENKPVIDDDLFESSS